MPKTKIDFSNIQVLEQGLSPANMAPELLDLSDKQTARIRRALRDEIEDWETETSSLQEKLRHWYDLSEGIIEDSDEPYPGAFHTHIDLIGIYLKVYTSIEKRSILGPEVLWYAEADPEFDEIQDMLPEVDSMMNFKARAEWNISESMGEVFPCANRDGLGVLKIPHVEQIEDFEDKVVVRNLQDLLEEFPPGESGISQREMAILAQMVQEQASEETPLEIPIKGKRITYSGPKAYVVERINFVTFPSNARSLDREYCRGHGDRFYIRREEVRQKLESKEWYEDACNEFLRKTKKSTASDPSSYRTNQESITGIERGESADEHEFYELTYWMRIDFKGVEKKYVFIYSKEHNILMFAKEYWYRTPSYYSIFRIERRANQIDGKSVVGQLEFINEEIDVLHNMRVQGWQITNIPSFKMAKDLNKELDLDTDENLWAPGVIFHLPSDKFDKFVQFDVRSTDQGQTMQEESNLFRIASLIMGIDAFLASGRPSPENPDAPGNKTQALIEQGNNRMQDPISELRYGVETAGEICMSHLYQFGPAQIQYKSQEGKQSITKYLSKRILRTGLRMKMQGITVVTNPDEEFKRGIEKWSIVTKEPLIAQNAKYRMEALRSAFRDGRVPRYERYLPTVEEIEAYNVEIQKKAMMQMQIEQQMKEQEAAQQQIEAAAQKRKQALGVISDKVKAQNLIQKILEQKKTQEALQS